jgi:hypothetical protein
MREILHALQHCGTTFAVVDIVQVSCEENTTRSVLKESLSMGSRPTQEHRLQQFTFAFRRRQARRMPLAVLRVALGHDVGAIRRSSKDIGGA